MELKQIKELMSVMQRTGTKRLVIKREGIELELEREENHVTRVYEPAVSMLEENPLKNEIAMHRANMMLSRGGEIQTTISNNTTASIGSKEMAAKSAEPASAGIYITSPMVGTFYLSPGPDEPHFIKVGDKVEKDSVACIIEAMKVMNEVKAGVTGTIVEILVENGHPVEFGTKLFRVV